MRVLLADDHAIVRTGLRAIVDAEPGMEVAAEAADGLEALRACEAVRPEILVADISMPLMNGIELTAQVLRLPRPPGVVVLSMHADETYVLRALSAGARGYILKSATDAHLVPAIRAVAAGGIFFSPRVSSMLLEDHLRRLQSDGLHDTYDMLTARERQILQLLAEGRSNKEVATLLGVEVSTVDTHRANLMQKLNVHNTAEIVLYAVRKGIVS